MSSRVHLSAHNKCALIQHRAIADRLSVAKRLARTEVLRILLPVRFVFDAPPADEFVEFIQTANLEAQRGIALNLEGPFRFLVCLDNAVLIREKPTDAFVDVSETFCRAA